MASNWNRRFEDRVAAALTMLVPELLQKELPPHEPPGPDRLTSLDGTVLGIEITRLHGEANEHGSQVDQQRSATTELFSLVQARVREFDAPCVVDMTLFGDVTGGQLRARTLASEVLGLLLPAIEAREELRLDRFGRHHRLPKEVMRLELLWRVPVRKPWVSLIGPGFHVRSDFDALLQHTLEEKAKRLTVYRQHCTLCWLVVVVPYYLEVQDGSGATPSLAHSYKSAFDRVLLLSYQLDRVWDVPLSSSA